MTPRLEALLALLEPCDHLVDVGTDHALVPLAAVRRGLAVRATGVDCRPAPLAAARRTLMEAGEDRVALVLGDGLAGVPDSEAVVMAGLGTATMIHVLAAAGAPDPHAGGRDAQPGPARPPLSVLAAAPGPTRLPELVLAAGPKPIRPRQLVLAPLTEPARLRRWARQAGWHLHREVLVAEGGRWFLAMRLTPGEGPDPAYDMPGWELEALEAVGPGLLRTGGDAVRAWLAAEHARLAAVSRVPGDPAGRLAAVMGRAAAALEA
ncbi:MAG: tRNA (adenine(22)-N(1))-methyltransferase TrmK [Candidatus Sericytochromatia bacterium]|nr:tRNA (adenine(22)-N(1))-methyltransferase TrmK [Candidatus Sericytochromatia bacterium]